MEINWNEDKNRWLLKNRGVSFEIVLEKIIEGEVIDNIPHPNKKKYPHQFIFIIKIDSYCYLVPYVTEGDDIFLKTMIPSRQMTKKYKERCI
jgi:uncharacterized DUF497 family protein